MGRYEIAIVLAALNLFTMFALAPLKKRLDQNAQESELMHVKDPRILP